MHQADVLGCRLAQHVVTVDYSDPRVPLLQLLQPFRGAISRAIVHYHQLGRMPLGPLESAFKAAFDILQVIGDRRHHGIGHFGVCLQIGLDLPG